ncbi:hypothetical protein V1512DRAFT_247392 [Lipomyces arxii]|uniref:uncharacterized protein n=1 Tax=Lipomyces arxii TaxID=56418 RepID=UPI0034CFF9F9
MVSATPPVGPPPSAAPPVPEGWLAKFDSNYKTYYYVNLATGKSQWEKPPNMPEAPPAYSHSQNQSPASFSRGQPMPNYGQPPYGQQPYGQQSMYGGGYPPQPGYGYPPQQGYYPQQPMYQQPMYQQPMYQQQQQQIQQPRRSGMGVGTGAALGAGAGLLGGMLLMDAMQPDVTVINNDYGDNGDMGGDMGGMGDMGGGF